MASEFLLRPPSHLPPATALQLSQQAPNILRNSAGAISTTVLQSLLAAAETPELWTVYENLLHSCLRTGDREAAHICLGRLVNRFGDDNERIMALIGLLKESDAADDNGKLDLILKEYGQILDENPTNVPIAKRRVALLRSLGRVPDAVTALVALLDFSPTDSEAWSELSDIYFSQGLYSQAVFALEEVLLLQPNAWNIHARLGELLLMAAKTGDQSDSPRQLGEALKRFCRSVELCDDYLRGYYGLKTTTQQLLGQAPKTSTKQAGSDGSTLPSTTTVQSLDALATEKLAEITRRFSAGEKGWQGYDGAEIAVARELLQTDSSAVAK